MFPKALVSTSEITCWPVCHRQRPFKDLLSLRDRSDSLSWLGKKKKLQRIRYVWPLFSHIEKEALFLFLSDHIGSVSNAHASNLWAYDRRGRLDVIGLTKTAASLARDLVWHLAHELPLQPLLSSKANNYA